MIEFKCQGCGKAFSVPDQFAGRRARCKACGAAVVVPARPDPTRQVAPQRAPLQTESLPLRTRRLLAEADQMRRAFGKSDLVRLDAAEGNPPERYRIRYFVRGLERPAGQSEPVERREHLVEIECTSEYPRISPRCRILTPIFHPNFDEATICVGDHWTAGERLVDLVMRIGEMIAYQAYNIKSPLNGEAAMWADLNQDKLPTDTCDLYALVDTALHGPAGTTP